MIKNEKLRITIRVAAVLFLVASLYLFGQEALGTLSHQKETKTLDQIKEEISEQIIDTTGTPDVKPRPKPEDIMGTVEFFNKLKQANKAYVGWIYMPGLSIDHPVVLAPNNSYYLNHGFYKAYNQYGTIFVDYRDTKVFEEPHLVIYGHHMKNNSMFSYLDTLRYKKNYEANKTFEIYTDTGVKKYLIFSVETVNADITTLTLPYTGNIQTLIAKHKKNALYQTGVDVSKATQLITLVTCTTVATNFRVLIHAIPIEN